MTGNRIVLKVGDRFNYLSFVREVQPDVYTFISATKGKECKQTKRRALWQCDCGKQVEIRLLDVKRGHAKSCGCLKTDKSRQTKRT